MSASSHQQTQQTQQPTQARDQAIAQLLRFHAATIMRWCVRLLLHGLCALAGLLLVTLPLALPAISGWELAWGVLLSFAGLLVTAAFARLLWPETRELLQSKPTLAHSAVLAEHLGSGEGALPLVIDGKAAGGVFELGLATLQRASAAPREGLFSRRTAGASFGLLTLALALVAMLVVTHPPLPVETPSDANPLVTAGQDQPQLAAADSAKGEAVERLRRALLNTTPDDRAKAIDDFIARSKADRDALEQAGEALEETRAAAASGDPERAKQAAAKAQQALEALDADQSNHTGEVADEGDPDRETPASSDPPSQAELMALEQRLRDAIRRAEDRVLADEALATSLEIDPDRTLRDLRAGDAGESDPQRSDPSAAQSGELVVTPDAWGQALAIEDATAPGAYSALRQAYADSLRSASR